MKTELTLSQGKVLLSSITFTLSDPIYLFYHIKRSSQSQRTVIENIVGRRDVFRQLSTGFRKSLIHRHLCVTHAYPEIKILEKPEKQT